MQSFLEFFTWDKITKVTLFFVKPLIILAVCKIVITLLLKLTDKILQKTLTTHSLLVDKGEVNELELTEKDIPDVRELMKSFY